MNGLYKMDDIVEVQTIIDTIKTCREPPIYLLNMVDPDQLFNGYTASHLWIRYLNKIPPKVIWCSKNLQDKNGNTLAMMCIKELRLVPPEGMWNDGNIVNSVGDTLAHLWVSVTKTMPPKDIWCNPETVDRGGYTLAMLIILGVKVEPPVELWHDACIACNGMTLASLWLWYLSTDVPEELRHGPEIKLTTRGGFSTTLRKICKYNRNRRNKQIPLWIE